MGTVFLAASFGLCAGYLDLAFMLLNKWFWHNDGYFRTARDSAWSVPIGHAVLLFSAGGHDRCVQPAAPWARRAAHCRVDLRIAGALGGHVESAAVRRMQLDPGDWGRPADRRRARRSALSPRRVRWVVPAIWGFLGVLAAGSTGWQTVSEHRAVAGLPRRPRVLETRVLIVWDTVRAYNISSYGYYRDTTPHLSWWASKGVQYNRAIAPAPWTYPSHSCFFTGEWPLRLNSQWNFKLEKAQPTLAEYLSTRGYQTAGFAANTSCCSYETGLARGFDHFEDYSDSVWSLLARTVPGKWILDKFLSLRGQFDPSHSEFYDKKWAKLQSRGARGINASFLDWLSQRRADRPFFAFLNYFDAHEPYVPPAGYEKRFGIWPRSPKDYQFLFDYVGMNKNKANPRDLQMARDCYDDCIAFLDEQLDQLLGTLEAQGVLENTDVIITSDHGEAFGEHGSVGHSYTVNMEEIGVPLVILSPRAGGETG